MGRSFSGILICNYEMFVKNHGTLITDMSSKNNTPIFHHTELGMSLSAVDCLHERGGEIEFPHLKLKKRSANGDSKLLLKVTSFLLIHNDRFLSMPKHVMVLANFIKWLLIMNFF